MKESARKRLEDARRIALLNLALQKQAEELDPLPPDDQLPSPGEVFIFKIYKNDSLGLEWLVVREHVDDPTMVFVVPLSDENPMVGSPDIILEPLKPPFGGGEIARCGEGMYIPKDVLCKHAIRIGRAPVDAVRMTLAQMARGKLFSTSEQRSADCDPEYESYMDEIRSERRFLEKKLGL